MKKSSLFLFVILGMTVLSGCELGDKLSEKYGTKEEPVVAEPVQGIAVGEPHPVSIVLSEQNASGQKGTAYFTEVQDGVQVVVNLEGAAADSKYPSHIHRGTCEELGGVKFSLNPIVDGTSTTLVAVTLDELKAEKLALNVHKSDSELSVYTACGNLTLGEQAATEEVKQEEVKAEVPAVTEEVKKEEPVVVEEKKVEPAPTPAPAPEAKTIDITANQFTFSPSTITVKEGTVVTVNLTSTDTEHGFSLAQFGVNVTAAAGETKSVTFTADKKGTYSFRCSVYCGEGHGEMTGTFIVE
jgi:heme/copper-type cytochrome/quinol oxidase subunit 2